MKTKAVDCKNEKKKKSQEEEWLEQALVIEKMLNDGATKTDIATKLGIARPTLYDRLRFLEEWRTSREVQD